MQRFCLAVLRFSLSAWVGIAVFFVVTVLDAMDAVLTSVQPDRIYTFNTTFFLPPYFRNAYILLGTAFTCAFLGLWNVRTGLLRRYATLLFAFAALGIVVLDYAMAYRRLIEILAMPTAIPASEFVMLYRQSRLLKGVVLGVSIVAASLALWPEASESREIDPAL